MGVAHNRFNRTADSRFLQDRFAYPIMLYQCASQLRGSLYGAQLSIKYDDTEASEERATDD